ncbi:hypothetical protein [Salipiger mucosus]|uniref:Putative peptidoglycan-binding protein domain protein-containing protein n=1 Tax=Salipiger mucosus DSM 16094 TaxID=1123237 RepID=S9QGW6_9RHOB|nr:hypothetical protein [Salipiger mucosus]EPX78863.1 Putative peptidoglycan-binding protein domain protein-containing protein [Salipiger mucosus DSM 16094]
MGWKGLLTAFRDEQVNGRSATASIGGHYGLPSIVAAAVNEIAKSSDPSAEQLVERSGFVQLSDLNGDGRTDYILDTSVTGSAFWCNAQSCAVRVFASTPEGYERNDFQAFNVTPATFTCQRGTCTKADTAAPRMASSGGAPAAPAPAAPETRLAAATVSGPVASAQPVVPSGAAPATAATSAAIPNFFGDAPAAASLESRCNAVSLQTSTNGGFVTAATMTDPDQALAEQFCLARSYAIARGEELLAQVSGVTPSQVAEQCAGFGQLMKTQVAAASVQPREAVLQEVGRFVLESGMSPAQLAKTAQICLGSGYRTDDLDAAIGSALALVALGRAPYAELLGHHLSQGFGTTERTDLSLAWYAQAIEAVDGGTTPVFSPGQPERVDLLRKASLTLGGNAATPAQAGPEVTQAAAIPVFGD